LKIGGELLDDPASLRRVVAAIARIASTVPLVIVHGGGKEIDRALAAAAVEKRQVEGLRITDEATLEVVVSVLAGVVNTRLVAALGAAGVSAVGLTGADGRCGLSERAEAHRTIDGRTIDLGRVGTPSNGADVGVVRTLAAMRFVPVIASIGVEANGALLNVNADTFAAHLAEKLGARRLIIAGTTPGVLGSNGKTVSHLDAPAIAALVHDGTAAAGMIAKLRACERAVARAVEDVVIVDGRDAAALDAALGGDTPANATVVVAGLPPSRLSALRRAKADKDKVEAF
jgi:acetylglutamate kinase